MSEQTRKTAAVEKIDGVFLDTLEPAHSKQGWGTLQKNRSVWEKELNIGGKRFRRGLGTHANSEIVYTLDGTCRRFQAWAGPDMATYGTLGLTVFVDGEKRWESGKMVHGDAPKLVDVDITARKNCASWSMTRAMTSWATTPIGRTPSCCGEFPFNRTDRTCGTCMSYGSNPSCDCFRERTGRFTMFLACTLLMVAGTGLLVPQDGTGQTVLGIADTRFTLNGEPTFLLGISYYGGLGASCQFVKQDLDDLQRYGFNWLRVWATWGAFQEDVSAVDTHGGARKLHLARLQRLVAECDRRKLVVDVTLTRGRVTTEIGDRGSLPDLAAHQQAVETLVKSLSSHRNWYLDLANERDVRDDRHVNTSELKQLRGLVRELDPRASSPRPSAVTI